MTAQEVGQKLVEYYNAQNFEAIYSELYSEDVRSIEASGDVAEGMAGINAKNEWWMGENELHSTSAEGPYPHGDQFINIYDMDLTERSTGNRFQMRETGLYTVKDGKVVEERFFYSMG